MTETSRITAPTIPTPTLRIIGIIHSTITDKDHAPKMGDEGGVEATITIGSEYLAAMADIAEGDELELLTWLHLADRDTLRVHPRGRVENPERGVFSTRSPDRPNPIGLHRVTVRAVSPGELRVAPLEALDGTPVVDIKPKLKQHKA